MALFLREIVAENIRKLRIQEGLTQVELAKKAKLTDVYISRVEQNAKNLTLDSVEQIANALGVPITSLIENTKVQIPKVNKGTVRSLQHAVMVLEAYIETLDEKN
jgi:transcriptional regulator with XRE-family HTH domain